MTEPVFKLRLYIAGDAQNSLAAVKNLHAICDRYLPGRHQIELVDVLLQPARALDEGIPMTPMLVRLAPLPPRKIVGSLQQTEVVLQALGLPTVQS